MMVINNVDFDEVLSQAVGAAKLVVTEDWEKIKDIVENVGKGIVNDVAFIAKKKLSGEFNDDDARVYIEDQKMLARVRLRSLAIVTLQTAERIWNAIAAVFRTAIEKALGGWAIL